MSTQSKKIAIQLGTFNGLSFTPISEYETPKVYDVWNMTSDWNVEWLKASARQRALEGRDRPGVGGFRYEARITFRTMLPAQAKAIRDLLNDIFEDPLFPHIVKISEDEDISNGVLCNLRSSAYGIRRELTVGRQAVNMEFAGSIRNYTTIGAGVDDYAPGQIFAEEFWWTLYEPLSVWEEDDYLVGFSYFQFLNETKGVGYDWIGPGWSESGSFMGEPDWNDPNAAPYDDGDSAYFHMYCFVAGMTAIPDQPGKIDENMAGVWNGDDNISAWMIEDQDGEKFRFTNSNFGMQYVDIWADLTDSYDGVIDGAGYLMFHYNPWRNTSNTDNPKLPEQEYRDNFKEMMRFGEKASKGLITSLKIYYRLEGDPKFVLA